MTLSNCGT
jgi:hypothetical protein